MRYRYLDDAKGFAIVLMLFTHTMGGENLIKTWVSSFHMPIFFVVCGVIMAGKYAGCVTAEQIVSVTKRRLVQIGIPYLVFGTVLACFYSLLNVIAGQPITFLPKMKSLLTLQGIDSLWFLPCYVLAEIFVLVMRLSKTRRVRLVLLPVVIVVICLLAYHMPTSGWQRMLVKTAIGWIFVETGAFLARYLNEKKIPVEGVIPLLALGAVLSAYNGFAAIGSLQLRNPVLFFLNAVLTSTAVLVLCRRMENKQGKVPALLERFGRNTIVVVCTNNLLIEIIRLLDYKLTGNILLNTGYTGCVSFTAILLALEYVLIRMAQGKLGVLFGKCNMV